MVPLNVALVSCAFEERDRHPAISRATKNEERLGAMGLPFMTKLGVCQNTTSGKANALNNFKRCVNADDEECGHHFEEGKCENVSVSDTVGESGDGKQSDDRSVMRQRVHSAACHRCHTV